MAKKLYLYKEPWAKCYLFKNYVIENKTMKQISIQLNVSPATVMYNLRKLEIKPRERHKGFKNKTHSKEVRQIISLKNKGKKISDEHKEILRQPRYKNRKHNRWNGHIKKRQDGYIQVYQPEHPNCNKDKYVMEHILVIEQQINRYLSENEIVHHMNGIRDDNRIENLKIMTKSEHMSYHAKKRWEDKRRNNDGQ